MKNMLNLYGGGEEGRERYRKILVFDYTFFIMGTWFIHRFLMVDVPNRN